MDLRQRPARLKVDGLLQDFGYLEMSPDVAGAIEARLARVGLQVEPSLHVAGAADVITIGRMLRARGPAPPPPAATPVDRGSAAARGSQAPQALAPAPMAPAPKAQTPPDREPELSAARVQLERLRTELQARVELMESELAARERELSDARLEADNLRAELEELALARSQAGGAAEAHLAEQRAALRGEPRELSELADALHETRAALTATQHEIRQILDDLLPEEGPHPAQDRRVVVDPVPATAAASEISDGDAHDVERPRRRGFPGRRR